MKVLVVDDDYAVLDAMKDVLEDEGYEVCLAANGLEALKELRKNGICVILLDLMMPVMNGWEFRQQQLEDRELAGIPTVIITAHNRPVENAQQLGIKHFISKPVKPELLIAAVGQYCH
jgi:CheY-like chemotaxis protein